MRSTARSDHGRVTARAVVLSAVVLTVALTAACSAEPSGADRTPVATTSATERSSTPTATPTDDAAADPAGTPTASAGATGAAGPSAPAFALEDPTTWTVSGDEVGPIALGGAVAGEVDDLRVAYERSGSECPASPDTTSWIRSGAPGLTVQARDGRVTGVDISAAGPDSTVEGGPTTAAGTGIGTSLEDLQAAYPELQYGGTSDEDRGRGSFWSIRSGSRYITSVLGADGAVESMWVGDSQVPPSEFCA
jgi:hypothetical protein